MVSHILEQDHAALIKLHQSMKPEERLTAFLNHSRLIQQVYETGKTFRSQAPRSKKDNKVDMAQ